MQSLGRRRKLVDIGLCKLGGAAYLIELSLDALKLLRDALTLMLGTRKRPAHLREASHHVAALLFEQTHIGIDAAHHVLHMAALLAEVAYKEAFLFEHDLELFKLALLFLLAVTGELKRRVGLFGRSLQVRPQGLQATQFIDSKNLRELVSAIGKVAVLARAVDLALKRTQLTRDLAVDVACTLEMLVHGGDLAQCALLAALVL